MRPNAVLLVIALFFASFSSALYAQLSVTPANNVSTATGLVNGVLVGGGLNLATNVTFGGVVGPNATIGQFSIANGSPNLGFESGIIMSSGPLAPVAGGCSGSGSPGSNNNFASGSGSGNGDPLLTAIVTANNACVGGGSTQTFDATFLKFTFTPTSDTIRFRYIFASEEYNEYVFTQFNDVFGFFISGPNPAGGNYTNKNIALLSDGVTPVSINSINHGNIGGFPSAACVNNPPTNPNLHVNNQSCAYDFIYDGFTVPLTAVAAVVPCSTYTLRLSIADVGDPSFDSAILLEANSFESTGLEITGTGVAEVDGKTYIGEGCGGGEFQIFRGTNLNQAVTIPFKIDTVNSTATLGVDYTLDNAVLVGDSGALNFGAFEILQIIGITPIDDGVAEGDEYVIISLPQALQCGGGEVKDTIYIQDIQPVNVTLQTPASVCAGAPLSISVSATGGLSPYSFSWYQNGNFVQSGGTLNIPALNENTTFEARVVDACGNVSSGNTVTATVKQPDPTQPAPVVVMPNDTVLCAGAGVSLIPQVSGGTGNYQFFWSTGQSTKDITVNPLVTTTYQLKVNDECNPVIIYDVTVSVNDSIKVSIGNVNAICITNSATLTATATGGNGNYAYSWNTVPPQNGATITVSPTVTTTYIVTASDDCGSPIGKDTVVVNVNQPLSISLPAKATTCEGSPVSLTAVAQGGDGTYNYQWSDGGGNNATASFTPLADTQYQLTVTDDCGTPQAQASVAVRVIPKMSSDFTLSKNVVCEKDEIIVTFKGSAPNDAAFDWNFGNLTVVSGADRGPYRLKPTTTGNQNVSLKITLEGCASPITTKTLTINPIPVAEFTLPDAQCYYGHSFDFTPDTPYDSTLVYQWAFNKGAKPDTVFAYSVKGVTLPGPDYYNATLTVKLGDCSSKLTRTFRVLTDAPLAVGVTDTVCSGFEATLSAVKDATDPFLSFEWYRYETGEGLLKKGTSYLTPRLEEPATYYLQARNSFGCPSPQRTPITAGIIEMPAINVTASSRLAALPQALIEFRSNITDPKIQTYFWTLGEANLTSTQANPVFQYREPGVYEITLTIVDTNGCVNSVILPNFIEIVEQEPIIVPNAFSPNEDLNNDQFFVYHQNITDFQIGIFNRFGQKLFESKDPNFRWDGKFDGGHVLEGVYFYYIKANSYRGFPIERSGSITVIR